MENSYGITNRNCMDDDANDSIDSISKKARQQKKTAVTAAKATTVVSSNDKENKVGANVVKSALVSAPSVKGAQQQNRQPPKSTRPIKETQNIRSNKGPREEKSKDIKPFERSAVPNNKQNENNSEQHYNLRIRDDTDKPQLTQQYNGNTKITPDNHNNLSEQNSNRRDEDRRPRRRGCGDGNRKTFKRRGKREFDRQYGSEKTGVKSNKRKVGGAHNCGSAKEDIEDVNKPTFECDPEKDVKGAQQTPAEEETKEIRLDEWMAQRAVRAKQQYNISKAVEGEDTSQWKKNISLQNRKTKEDENINDELEYDLSMYRQRGLNRGCPRVGGPNNSTSERRDRRASNRNSIDRQDNDGVERTDGDRPRERRDEERRERSVPYVDEDATIENTVVPEQTYKRIMTVDESEAGDASHRCHKKIKQEEDPKLEDIIAFRGTLNKLKNLNEEGRSKLSALRKQIGKLDDCANDEGDPEIAKEVELHRRQLSRTLRALRRSSMATMLEIEKIDNEELLTSLQSELSHRNLTKHSRSSLISQQDSVMEKMLPTSMHLSETTQDSVVCVETLIASSANVEGTCDEQEKTAEPLNQRKCSDKIFLFSFFAFFIAELLFIATILLLFY